MRRWDKTMNMYWQNVFCKILIKFMENMNTIPMKRPVCGFLDLIRDGELKTRTPVTPQRHDNVYINFCWSSSVAFWWDQQVNTQMWLDTAAVKTLWIWQVFTWERSSEENICSSVRKQFRSQAVWTSESLSGCWLSQDVREEFSTHPCSHSAGVLLPVGGCSDIMTDVCRPWLTRWLRLRNVLTRACTQCTLQRVWIGYACGGGRRHGCCSAMLEESTWTGRTFVLQELRTGEESWMTPVSNMDLNQKNNYIKSFIWNNDVHTAISFKSCSAKSWAMSPNPFKLRPASETSLNSHSSPRPGITRINVHSASFSKTTDEFKDIFVMLNFLFLSRHHVVLNLPSCSGKHHGSG